MKLSSFLLRSSAIVEMAIFFAGAIAIDSIFLDGHRFATVSPHPFWIIVLLMAAQYGTNEGLLAVALSTAIFLPHNIPEQQLDEEYYIWILQVTKLPLLWAIAASVIGEITERRRRDRARLESELDITQTREHEITQAYDRLSKVRESLERLIAGQLKTVQSVYTAAREIEKLEPSEVLVGIDGLVNAVIAPEKYSVFLLNQNRVEAAFNRGWTATDTYRREFDETDLIYQSVVIERKLLCITDERDEYLLEGQGLLAGLLISADTDEIIGMLKVEAVPFRDFTPATVQNFQLVCNWIGTAFANARRFENQLTRVKRP
jgi:hypothetical protein